MKAAKAKVKTLKGRIADINAKRDLRARFAKSEEDLIAKAFGNLAWVDVTDADDALLFKWGEPYYAWCNGLPLPMAAKLGDTEALEYLTNLKRVNAGYLFEVDEHVFYNTRPAELQVTIPMAKLLEMQRLWKGGDVFFVPETQEILVVKGVDYQNYKEDYDRTCAEFRAISANFPTALIYHPYCGGLIAQGDDHTAYDYILPAHESYYSANPFFGLTEYQPPKIADVVSL